MWGDRRFRTPLHGPLTWIALGTLAFALLAVAVPSAPAVTLAAAVSPTHESGGDRPNIVLILTDDQRVGTQVGMPEVMAQIAQKGTTYSQAFVPTSWCCPSRASLLTGKYSHDTGVWENMATDSYGAWPAFAYGGEEQDTLATRLSSAGYRTGLFGKYLNALDKAPPHYVPPGWSDFAGLTAASYTKYTLTTDDTQVTFPRRYLTDELADRAVDFIESTPSDQPLMTYFAPFAPHSPFDAGPYAGSAQRAGVMDAVRAATQWPNPAVGQTDVSQYPDWVATFPDTNDVPLTPEAWGRTLEEQQDALMGVDAAVSRILRALEQSGRLSNTLIVFTSDNGYSLGEHGLERKNTPYDFSIRVPLILRYDGHVPGGAVDDRLAVANLDVYSTILAAAGVPAAVTDGVDLLTAEPARTSMVVEAARWRGIGRPPYCGIRTKDHLYVRYGTGEEELFDYANDPYELTNLAVTGGAERQRERLAWMAKKGCQPTPPGFKWDPMAPDRAPSPPDHVSIEPRRDGTMVAVSWRAPRFTYGSPLVRYVVTSAPGSHACSLTPPQAVRGLRCFVWGLKPGTKYQFRVRVETSSGISRAGTARYEAPADED